MFMIFSLTFVNFIFRTIVGIPLFWLKAFKNVPTIAEMIQPCDEPILSYLIDVKSILLEADPMVRSN